jgi:YidC/Oxa1 family membrane protein insertase
VDRNTLLAFVLSMGVLTLWFIWKAQTVPVPPQRPGGPTMAADGPEMAPAEPEWGHTPEAEGEAARGAEVELAEAAPGSRVDAAMVEEAAAELIEPWQRTFDMGLYEATLTNRGGGLTSWRLAEYFEQGGDKDDLIELLQLEPRYPTALETPFRELGLGDLGSAMYRVEAEDEHGVTFVLQRGGVVIRKQYVLRPEYGFDLLIEVYNGTDHMVRPRFEVEWPAVTVRKTNDFRELSLVAYDGEEGVTREPVASVGSGGFFGRLFGGGDDEGPTRIASGVKWAGVDIRFFVSVLMPEDGGDLGVTFEPRAQGKAAAAVLAFAPLDVAPGQQVTRRLEGFAGPKRSDLLAAVGGDLGRSVNLGYSWVEPLTIFFHWLLSFLYGLVPNYGIAIIVITIMVRVVTLPIMGRQMKSMEKMRAVQPFVKELQEKHADDKAKQSEAMMALYKEHGVNPLGGCLPMVLQLPVFIGLFYALQSSFALRNAPFVFWISDLSAPEVLFEIPGLGFPVRLLPLIMGGSMVLQQKMTPTTIDPAQARMMLVMMPIMMTVLFYQFPSGLVLYWMVSNLLGIAHQLWVRRGMAASEAAS